MPTEDRVRITVEDHVAVVTLTRPDKHNALDIAMFEAIIAAAARLREEAGVRAVVLHGDGPELLLGARRREHHVRAGERRAAASTGSRERGAELVPAAAYDWVRVPVPVIAAIHGNCFGGGLQIALGADIRIATPDARLSVMEIKWGLIPDMSITRTLPRLVGIDVAKELTYTARVFSGAEAASAGRRDPGRGGSAGGGHRFGSRDRVEVPGRDPARQAAVRRVVERLARARRWRSRRELQRELIGSPNQIAAVTAGFTKEPGGRSSTRAPSARASRPVAAEGLSPAARLCALRERRLRELDPPFAFVDLDAMWVELGGHAPPRAR